MTAETPIFIGQIFCFVKLKIILDALHIFVRSLVFITLVLINHNIAIYAFGIAQLISIFVVVGGNYAFFYIYIKNLTKYRVQIKKKDENVIENSWYKNMDDFPFNGITEMIPGVLPNEVNFLS